MRFYLRFGEGGLYYVDSELSIEEFINKIRSGESIQPLYNVLGKQRRYPKGLSQMADIYPSHPLIPFDSKGTKYNNEQRGFIALAFEYDKTEILEIIYDMDPTIKLETDIDIEQYLCDNGFLFLSKVNCTVLRKEWFGKCILDPINKIVIFLSQYCMLLQGSKPMVIFGNAIYELLDNNPFSICYIPCIPEDIVYGIYISG